MEDEIVSVVVSVPRTTPIAAVEAAIGGVSTVEEPRVQEIVRIFTDVIGGGIICHIGVVVKFVMKVIVAAASIPTFGTSTTTAIR